MVYHLSQYLQSPELEPFASSYFNESSFKDQIEFINGDALEVIPTLRYKWDLVFIDASIISWNCS